ncbi:MAG: hypothetical protein JO163_08820 [Methylobacteriaceae bacterium]|nr:hypothetical protein [Methylobacteriaceae bacterium]MBV9702817.1 hypothetical protein [Methylobacteriaceae bacterium]
MSIASRHERADAAVALRCDRPEVARRQLDMSVGLVVALLLATFAVTIAMPIMNRNAKEAAATFVSAVAPTKRQAVWAPVRVLPSSTIQAEDRAKAAPRG